LSALAALTKTIFCYVEDVDLGFRARLSGETCVQLNSAVVSHVGYGSSGRRSAFATYHGARNRFWTFFKNTPGWALWLLTPLHLAMTALLWLSAARFGQFGLFGKALSDALNGWPQLMEKRRAVMADRQASTLAILGAMTWNPLGLLTRAPRRSAPQARRLTADMGAVSEETVQSVRHYTDRLFAFRVTRPQSFRFRSGEFVMLGLKVDGKPLLRAYSVASPSWDEELEFFSIKVPDGPLTSRSSISRTAIKSFWGPRRWARWCSTRCCRASGFTSCRPAPALRPSPRSSATRKPMSAMSRSS
jgi:hypothetical protein